MDMSHVLLIEQKFVERSVPVETCRSLQVVAQRLERHQCLILAGVVVVSSALTAEVESAAGAVFVSVTAAAAKEQFETAEMMVTVAAAELEVLVLMGTAGSEKDAVTGMLAVASVARPFVMVVEEPSAAVQLIPD